MAKELRESVRDQRLREAERLLKEERLGLDAVTQAFLQTTPSPEALMERLDLMAQNAMNSKISQTARDAIIFGQELFRRRLERHVLKQMELLPRDAAESLANPNGGQGSLIEPADLHGAQAAADRELKERLLAIYRAKGGLSDVDLTTSYKQTYGGNVSAARIKEARVTLRRQGLLFNRDKDNWIWDLREREATNEA